MLPTQTTDAKATLYQSVAHVFSHLLSEMRELSKKKPDLMVSEFKVKQINRVLIDVLEVVKDEPEAKYIEILDSDMLPQNADCVLVMAQFEAALSGFHERYYRYYDSNHRWVTEEYIARSEVEYYEEDDE